MQHVVLYATDTMADWEYGYLVAGLAMANQGEQRFSLTVASDGGTPVRTMGGIAITAERALGELDPSKVDLLVLPGADTWTEGHDRALALAGALIGTGTPVAAICGATYGLARAGLLDERAHTSNAADFVAAAPGYHGAEFYRDTRVVDADGLITAGGVFPLDFARAVFERLQAFPAPVIDAWYGLYSTGERRYFDALMGAA